MVDVQLTPGPPAGESERALEAEELAGAARRVVDALVEAQERPGGGELSLEREALSAALGDELTCREFATVVAEASALGWVESGGAKVELPGPLQPVEAVLMRPGSGSVAVALEGLRQVAARSRIEGRSAGLRRDLYEPFLVSFDPEARARSSVHLTPQPLVKMLVRSVDELLRDRLGMGGGLESSEVGLLEPAVGTGAFLLEALRMGTSGQASGFEGQWAKWQCFEIRPGAYVAAALRLDRWRRAAESGGRRARPVDLCYGNALAEDSLLTVPEMGWRGDPQPSSLVVVGNPPWSSTHVCSGWMERLLREGFRRHDGSVDDGYFRYQGRRLDSRNPKWLRAQYVQFLRLAQWCVERVGRGVVALVLPDGIADNLTFAGLRESLLDSFEEIFLVDLGGSSRKVPTETGPDENLFGVRQGVCAVAMVKGGTGRGVFRVRVRGRRREKLAWLGSHTVSMIGWEGLTPGRPGHVFLVGTSSHEMDGSYWQAPSIPEIFETGSIGVITGRDAVVVGFGERELAARIGMLRQADGDGRVWELFGLNRSPQLEEALEKLAADEDWERHLVPYLFRPGDRRVLFSEYLVTRPRTRVMAEVRWPGNVALLLPRRRRVFPSAWVTDRTASHRVASSYEGTYAFPLHLGSEGQANVSADLVAELSHRYGYRPSAEEILGFIYAVLWDEGFHERYSEALRVDWPRIPFPQDWRSFEARSRLGWRLARFHLGWQRPRNRTWFHGELPVRLPAEPARVFSHHGERLELGLGGYLAPVSRRTLEQRVGGYPVVRRWVQRRAGRRLGTEEIEDLSGLVDAVEATREVQQELCRVGRDGGCRLQRSCA